MRSALLAVVAALAPIALAACGGGGSGGGGKAAEMEAPKPGNEPRLVVLLVVDQWPEWAFEAKRAALTGGFDRLLREGEWHVGQHPSAATVTAVGHSLLGTGEPPYHSGILANDWWHRDLERRLTSVEDENGAPTAKWLRVPGLGDAIAASKSGGKAVAVSLKDRAAILPLGHAGLSIWYDWKTATWVSLAERGPAPAWLATWNTEHPVSAHFHDVWTPLPETAQLAGVADDAPGEVGEEGMGPTFPHALDTTKNPAKAIFATPIGNELVFDTATAALDHERLGADSHPDLLVISLSSHDYIGHGWGQESLESWDTFLRIDRRLGQFLTDLDHKVGAGRWAMIVTSDHGASPKPDEHGGRISFAQIKDAANHAAMAELGRDGEWIADVRFPTLYLSKAALAAKPKELATALTKIVLGLRAFPGFARVEKTADFAGHCETRTGDALVLCMALDPERSGEIVYMPAPGWVLQDGDEPVATGHGSMNPYDRLVPMIMLAPGHTPHAPLMHPDDTVVQEVRVSTVIARWLGVTPPLALKR